MTKNEWFKAKRFKEDYYLYYILQNPAENLEPEENVEVVRYVIPFKEIITKGDECLE